MSTTAAIVGALGLVAVGITLITLLVRAGTIAPGTKPDGWDGSNASQEWDEKAKGAGSDFGLTGIRETAGKWATSIAALLGVLSTVAFVAGPSDLAKDVGGTEAEIAAWLILGAAAFAAIATLLAALAEQGVPQHSDSLTGWVYRNLTEKRAKQAAGQLMASRVLAIVALLAIVTATGIAWLSAVTGDEKAASQSAIVQFAEGTACGTVTKSGTQVSLTVGTETQRIPSDAKLTLVDSCP